MPSPASGKDDPRRSTHAVKINGSCAPNRGRIDHFRAKVQLAYGIIHTFPGGTKEQYEAAIAAVHPGKDILPRGQVFHFAGPSADGWIVVAIFDTEENWMSFRDGILMPAMQRGVPGGFTAPPQEQTFEVDYNGST